MLWLLLSGVAVSVLMLAFVRREALKRVARWKTLPRSSGDLRPGVALLEVQVAADAGTFVDLGMSKEAGDGASASPTIETHAVKLRASDGTELLLPGGRQLEIRTIPGARRRLIESVTTESGIEHRYSFELAGGKDFLLIAELPPAGEQMPFRSAAPRELRPIRGKFLAGMRLLPDYHFGGGAAAGMIGGAVIGGLIVGLPAGAFISAFVETVSIDSVAGWCCLFGALIGVFVGEVVSIPEDAVR